MRPTQYGHYVRLTDLQSRSCTCAPSGRWAAHRGSDSVAHMVQRPPVAVRAWPKGVACLSVAPACVRSAAGLHSHLRVLLPFVRRRWSFMATDEHLSDVLLVYQNTAQSITNQSPICPKRTPNLYQETTQTPPQFFQQKTRTVPKHKPVSYQKPPTIPRIAAACLHTAIPQLSTPDGIGWDCVHRP